MLLCSARYLILAGALRFVIEFIRVNDQVAGPLTLAQLFSVAIMAVGLWFIRSRAKNRRRAGR